MSEDAEARREIAVQKQRLDDHEDRCAERWEANHRAMEALHNRWRWLMGTMVTAQGAVILMLIKILTDK